MRIRNDDGGEKKKKEKEGEKDWESNHRSEYCQGRVLSCPASKIIVNRT